LDVKALLLEREPSLRGDPDDRVGGWSEPWLAICACAVPAQLEPLREELGVGRCWGAQALSESLRQALRATFRHRQLAGHLSQFDREVARNDRYPILDDIVFEPGLKGHAPGDYDEEEDRPDEDRDLERGGMVSRVSLVRLARGSMGEE
jgi:hypothetical protein